jgi:AAA+ superfamily predicted ATPase
MPVDDSDALAGLLKARHPLILLCTVEESHALEVARDAASDLSRHMLIWRVTEGLKDGLVRDEAVIPDTAHPAGALTHLGHHTPAATLIVMLDVAGHLKDERTLRCLRDLIEKLEAVGSTLILLDACDELPPAIRAAGIAFELTLPGAEDIEEIMRRTARELHLERAIEIQLRKEDLAAIVQNLQGLSRRQVRQAVIEAIAQDRKLDASDIAGIIAFKKRALSGIGVLEPVESFATLDEIGGMGKLKTWLELRRTALSEEAIEFGVETPRGVLMLGVQGSGKSLSAKAIATAWKRPLVRMDVGALFDRYIGESERRLRDALQQAEMMAPVVLWIDEIEKAFASAASHSIDGGLSKRMFGALLTWMQEHTRPVFVIATANDVSALPPELLRKGRFDEIFFIDLPSPPARKQIWEIHLSKRRRDPELFDIDTLVHASDGFSGAEIEAAIKAAIHEAFAGNSLLSTERLVSALRASPPLSVTMAEKMADLRAWAAGRCMPAE